MSDDANTTATDPRAQPPRDDSDSDVIDIESVLPIDEVELLLRYAVERGLDPEAKVTVPLYEALTEYRGTEGAARQPACQKLIAAYGQLAAKTYKDHEVNGRTLRETRAYKWPFRWILLTGIVFFVAAMGTEIADLYYEDALEPEEGAELFLINFHRYVLTYLSPFVWGGLGACVYLAKRLSDARANQRFERQRFQGLTARIGIGALLGAVVVLVYGAENFVHAGFNLDANAIAFFVGVGMRVFYELIESTINTVAEGLRRRITGEDVEEKPAIASGPGPRKPADNLDSA